MQWLQLAEYQFTVATLASFARNAIVPKTPAQL